MDWPQSIRGRKKNACGELLVIMFNVCLDAKKVSKECMVACIAILYKEEYNSHIFLGIEVKAAAIIWEYALQSGDRQ